MREFTRKLLYLSDVVILGCSFQFAKLPEIKWAVSATPLFMFTSGNDKLNCLKETPKIYPITKRNS